MALKIIRNEAAAPAEPLVRTKQRPKDNFDSMCRVVLETSPNAAIPWLLMASWLYYHHDVSLFSDEFYDELAKAILDAWDDLEHMHKHLLTREMLEAGSLFQIKEAEYPAMTKGAASQIVRGQVTLRG